MVAVSFLGHGQVLECRRFQVQNNYLKSSLLMPQGKKRTSATDHLALQNSILDAVREQAHDLERSLSQRDKNKLDEYFTSVRDVEKGIARRRQWIDVPKPEAMIKQPQNRNMVEDLPLLYDLIVMALQTNTTKIATLEIGGDFNPADLGIRGGYHSLSHHGQLQERIDALITLETYQIKQFVRFVKSLQRPRMIQATD